jgi:DNA repair protein RecN (Recombination protein N)
MLQELAIRNFAIIDDARIRFGAGITVLSGETGAGKSIVVNALNLLLGGRASARMVRTGAAESEVEALFDVSPEGRIAEAMTAQGFSPDEGLLVRRIISASDRHRVYVNGRLSTLQQLEELTGSLASISGQHAHQALLRDDRHLDVIDRFGGWTQLRRQVQDGHRRLAGLVEERNRLRAKAERQAEERGFLEHQLRELEQVAPSPGEDEALEAERFRLRNAESLVQTVERCIDRLYAATGSATDLLGETAKDLAGLVRIDEALEAAAVQLEDLRYRTEDVAGSLRDYLAGLDLDPGRLDAVEARLDQINRIKRKHGGSLAAALDRQEGLAAELDGLDALDERIDAVERQMDEMRREALEAARSLSRHRRTAAGRLTKRIESELAALEMARTRFGVAFEANPVSDGVDERLRTADGALRPWGLEKAAFLISPNPGEAMKPLASIASGGELSRVILALKCILSNDDGVETLVFDEVDAGIGGSVAERVGRKLKELSGRHQVICITHLAQIAKFADHHFRISKRIHRGKTATIVEPLGAEERVGEIARMLGGARITAKTMAHAREMLAEADAGLQGPPSPPS